MITYLDNDVAFESNGESRMMPLLVNFLRKRRMIRPDTSLIRELPINGRRVDLAASTKSGIISAYELKIGGFGRVLEQAVYNLNAFDNSWIVVPTRPRQQNLHEAAEYGVGVIVVSDTSTDILIRTGESSCDREARRRVRLKFNQFSERSL